MFTVHDLRRCCAVQRNAVRGKEESVKMWVNGRLSEMKQRTCEETLNMSVEKSVNVIICVKLHFVWRLALNELGPASPLAPLSTAAKLQEVTYKMSQTRRRARRRARRRERACGTRHIYNTCPSGVREAEQAGCGRILTPPLVCRCSPQPWPSSGEDLALERPPSCSTP